MAVPKQVQDNADRADKIQSDLSGTAQKPATPDEPGTAPVVTPPVSQTPNQSPAQSPEDLEQRYKSLEGRNRGQAEELKAARANNDLLYRQVSDLNREIAGLKTSLVDAQATPKTDDNNEPDTGLKLIDEAKIEQYGAEFGDMARTINQILQGQKPVEPAPVVPAVPAPAPQKPDKMMFRSAVIVDVYSSHQLDYNDIDVAPEFSSWLKEFNQRDGVQHLQQWSESISVRDKATCLSIINNFLVSPQGLAFKTRLKPNQQIPAPNQQPNVPLGTNVDVTNVQTQPVGKIYTGAEITKFFTDVSGGVYKDNPEEATRIEADIMKAPGEGRVRG